VVESSSQRLVRVIVRRQIVHRHLRRRALRRGRRDGAHRRSKRSSPSSRAALARRRSRGVVVGGVIVGGGAVVARARRFARAARPERREMGAGEDAGDGHRARRARARLRARSARRDVERDGRDDDGELERARAATGKRLRCLGVDYRPHVARDRSTTRGVNTADRRWPGRRHRSGARLGSRPKFSARARAPERSGIRRRGRPGRGLGSPSRIRRLKSRA